MKRIKFRNGKGCPLERSTGIESAAASETTPRIPAQPKMIGILHPGFLSCTVMKCDMNRVKSAAPNVLSNLAMSKMREIARP